MNETLEKTRTILERRLQLVGEISRLNAEQLRNTQQLSGNQIDLMRHAEDLHGPSVTAETDDSLSQAERRDATLKTRIKECDHRIQQLEDKVAELDRELEDL